MTLPANRKLLLLALLAASVAAAPACSSGGDSKPPDTGGEDCNNGLDDDADGAVDCGDLDCQVLESCQGCTTQAECSPPGTTRVELICDAGECAPAGALTPDGESVARGNVMVRAQLEQALVTLAPRNHAYLLEVFAPVKPDGTATTCDDLLEAGRFGGEIVGFNRIGMGAQAISNPSDVTPAAAFNMPVTAAGSSALVMVRFYGVYTTNGTAGGEMLGMGCTPGVVIPEGAFVDDEAHNVDLIIRAPCSPNDASTCPEGKSCVRGMFVCRDTSCTDCGDREVCRDSMCRRECDPATLANDPCPELQRCDTTPGERTACVPVE